MSQNKPEDSLEKRLHVELRKGRQERDQSFNLLPLNFNIARNIFEDSYK